MSAPYFSGLLEEPQLPPPQMAMMGAPSLLGPQAPPMPAQTPPKLSLFERFKQKMSQGLGAIQEGIMPTPEGMDGLLSPAMTSDARHRGIMDMASSLLAVSGPTTGPAPSTGQAIGQALQAGRAGYDQALQQNMQGGLLAQQQKKANTLEEQRAAIQAKYQLPPNASPDQVEQALKGMFADFVRNGDTEMVGRLAQVMPSLSRGESPEKAPHWEDFGGRKILVGPNGLPIIGKDGQPVTMDKTPSPRDPNAPDTAKQLRDQRMFAREQQLTDDYNRDTRESREMAVKVSGAIAEGDAAKAGDGIAQTNLLYAFVSSMDPGSAVREGEIGLVRSAGSLVQQAQGILAKYAQGQAVTIPPAMVDQMVNLMKRRLEGSRRYVNSRAKYYTGRAKRWGLEGADDLFPGIEDATPPAAGAAGGADKVRQYIPR